MQEAGRVKYASANEAITLTLLVNFETILYWNNIAKFVHLIRM